MDLKSGANKVNISSHLDCDEEPVIFVVINSGFDSVHLHIPLREFVNKSVTQATNIFSKDEDESGKLKKETLRLLKKLIKEIEKV